MQFSPHASEFCNSVLTEEGATDLIMIPSRYMQLILCGERHLKKPGAVVTAVLISALSICCAIAEDLLQFSLHARILSLLGRILCCVVFLFQFDMLFKVDKRKILMMLYLVYAFFTGNSFCIHLIILIIFNLTFFKQDTGVSAND